MTVDDEVTPFMILNNTALHLGGPPRTVGAVMIGHAGILVWFALKFFFLYGYT